MTARVLDFKPEGYPSAASALHSTAPRVGYLTNVGVQGDVQVEFPGSGGPVLARVALQTNFEQLARAVAERQPAVFLFENGELDKPLLVGLITVPACPPPPTGGVQSSMPTVDQAHERVLTVEADADGSRVQVSAEREIVFKCGKASVTLQRSGRILIRGTYVETQSSGTNRIKGGQVRIN